MVDAVCISVRHATSSFAAGSFAASSSATSCLASA